MMLRDLILLLLVNFVVVFVPSGAFGSFADSNQDPLYHFASAEFKVSRAMVQLVRNEYRMAIHITDRMLACFTNDTEWFDKNARDIRDQMSLCETRMEQIRDKVKKQLPMMRIYLALSMRNEPYRPVGSVGVNEDPNLYQFPTDLPVDSILNEMRPEANNIAHPQIRHTFPTVDIAPLNTNELNRALKILNNDLAWVQHKYGSPEPLTSATCFTKEKTFPVSRTIPPHKQGVLTPKQALVFTGDGIGVGERSCYYDLYISAMFGGQVADKPWTEAIEGFPLLAYISGDNSSDEEIIKALRKRIELTRNAKKDFEQRYYYKKIEKIQIKTSSKVMVSSETLTPRPDLSFSYISELLIYENLADKIVEGAPELRHAVGEAKQSRQYDELQHTLLTVGAVLAAIPICSNLFTGTIAKGLCLLPFGLGFNGYMIYESETLLRRAVDDMLMSPNGLRVLSHVDSLDDYQFSRNLEWMMLPIGTGLGSLKKGFSAFLKTK